MQCRITQLGNQNLIYIKNDIFSWPLKTFSTLSPLSHVNKSMCRPNWFNCLLTSANKARIYPEKRPNPVTKRHKSSGPKLWARRAAGRQLDRILHIAGYSWLIVLLPGDSRNHGDHVLHTSLEWRFYNVSWHWWEYLLLNLPLMVWWIRTGSDSI